MNLMLNQTRTYLEKKTQTYIIGKKEWRTSSAIKNVLYQNVYQSKQYPWDMKTGLCKKPPD